MVRRTPRSAAATHDGRLDPGGAEAEVNAIAEFARNRFDVVKGWQAGLVAEMLDLVGGGVLRELKMLFPALLGVLNVGIDVSAMEHVAGAAGVAHPRGGHRQRRKRATVPLSSYQSTPRSPSVTPPILQPRLLR